MPDGTEQGVWRWSLDIKPGLDGAQAAARKHVAEKIVLDGIGAGSSARIEALNKATEAFSAARVALKQPRLPEMTTSFKTGIPASANSASDGTPLRISFNPDAFSGLDGLFKENVADRLEAGIVRHNAIPSAEEAAKTIAFHEFGHIVFNRSKLKDKDIRLLRIFDRAIATGDIDSVSEYAKLKPHGREFFAEAFAMWKNGEHLPDHIVRFVKEVAT